MQRNESTTAVNVPLNDYQIHRRILARRTNGESYDEIIERLLDATVEEISIEAIADDIFNHYDHVAGVAVKVTDNEQPNLAQIVVSTDVPDFEHPSPLYRSGRYRLSVENDGEVLCSIPFIICAEPYGPQYDTIRTTPIFVDGEIALVDGIERLRNKIGKPHDELPDGICGQQVTTY